MQLGFVSAILPDLSFDEVFEFAAETGFDCVEVMCWPPGKADRRYSGITHIDVTSLDTVGLEKIRATVARTGVNISGLGYYPNPLTPDQAEAKVAADHILEVVQAAKLLDLDVVSSFVGRDWTLSVDANWQRFVEVWSPIIAFAEAHGIKIAIENCPMLFTRDEWPGGKNLATTPAIWRRMYEAIPSMSFGLNYDPSHLVWMQMDYIRPLRDFASRIFRVHLKDARVDRDRLDEVGILAHPLEYHSPKLPGLGEVDWGCFLSVLGDSGYKGPVCIEVEDRAYEGSLEDRKKALRQSHDYIRQFIGRD